MADHASCRNLAAGIRSAWVMKALVGLLAIGFFAAMVFSWVFEFTPDGLKRDGDRDVEMSLSPSQAKQNFRQPCYLMYIYISGARYVANQLSHHARI